MGRGYGRPWLIALAIGVPVFVALVALQGIRERESGGSAFGLLGAAAALALTVVGITLWLIPIASALRFIRKRLPDAIVFIGRVDPSSSFRPRTTAGLSIVSVDDCDVTLWSPGVVPSSVLQLNRKDLRRLERTTVELYGFIRVPALSIEGERESGTVDLRVIPSNSAFRVLYPMGETEIDRLVGHIQDSVNRPGFDGGS
jgi:hypothetical protein